MEDLEKTKKPEFGEARYGAAWPDFLEKIKKLALEKDIESQKQLGKLYLEGKFVKRDPEEAIRLWKLADYIEWE